MSQMTAEMHTYLVKLEIADRMERARTQHHAAEFIRAHRATSRWLPRRSRQLFSR